MSKFCKNCGAQLTPGAGFCDSCGARTQDNGQVDAAGDADGRARTEEKIAAAKAVIDQSGCSNERYADMGQNQDMPGPLGFLKSSVRAGVDSLRRLLKNPKQLIPMFVLSVLWLILSILPALGINSWPVRLLSFMTFAQGGMYGGIWGAVGGVIGKAIFAYFISALVLPLFSGKNPFKGIGKSFKSLASGLAVHNANAAGLLILGIGLALIAFNFFTGNASMVNSMAGVAGFVLAVKSLWGRGGDCGKQANKKGPGFIRGLLLSVANKLSKGRIPTQMTVSRVVSGYAAGSAAGVALSALRLPHLPYALGVLLVIVGLVLSIAVKPGKEAAAI